MEITSEILKTNVFTVYCKIALTREPTQRTEEEHHSLLHSVPSPLQAVASLAFIVCTVFSSVCPSDAIQESQHST
jgi:hypothetical protein